MSDCIFCKIASGEIPVNAVYEDEYVFAFNDINPVAPVHVLIIPKEHVESVNDIDDKSAAVLPRIFLAAKGIAKELGIDESGYRIINNCGSDGGQTVFHLHFHLLGGRKFEWPHG